MKVIVAGPRTFKNHQFVYQVLDAVIQRSDIIIQGGAYGIDRIAKTWARTHHVACRDFEITPERWEKEGKRAGHNRNAEMAREADALIAFWDGSSAGTGDMIRQMQLLGKNILYVRFDDTETEEALAALYSHYE